MSLASVLGYDFLVAQFEDGRFLAPWSVPNTSLKTLSLNEAVHFHFPADPHKIRYEYSIKEPFSMRRVRVNYELLDEGEK